MQTTHSSWLPSIREELEADARAELDAARVLRAVDEVGVSDERSRGVAQRNRDYGVVKVCVVEEVVEVATQSYPETFREVNVLGKGRIDVIGAWTDNYTARRVPDLEVARVLERRGVEPVVELLGTTRVDARQQVRPLAAVEAVAGSALRCRCHGFAAE